jgi:hypothetical protein
MTAEEAVSLIIKADLMGRGGDVFWLDMGQPLRIGDLAERIIDWATLEGQPRVGIDIIGLRPGEKLREELTTQGLEMKTTSHARIWYARQLDVSRTSIQQAITRLRRACAAGDAAMALETLIKAVPDYEASDLALKTARLASLRVNAPSIRCDPTRSVDRHDVGCLGGSHRRGAMARRRVRQSADSFIADRRRHRSRPPAGRPGHAGLVGKGSCDRTRSCDGWCVPRAQ